jgi:hypothetical protein
MPKRIKHQKRSKDVNQLAHHLVELSTQEEPTLLGPWGQNWKK